MEAEPFDWDEVLLFLEGVDHLVDHALEDGLDHLPYLDLVDLLLDRL